MTNGVNELMWKKQKWGINYTQLMIKKKWRT